MDMTEVYIRTARVRARVFGEDVQINTTRRHTAHRFSTNAQPSY